MNRIAAFLIALLLLASPAVHAQQGGAVGSLNSTTTDLSILTPATGFSFSGSSGTQKWGANSKSSVAAGGTLGIGITSGLIILSDISNGGTAVVYYDGGLAAVNIIAQSSTNFVTGADPGAGTSKWWVQPNGVVTNRYATAKNIDYAIIATRGGTLN